MSTLKKLMQLSMILLVMVAMFSSCEKEDLKKDEPRTEVANTGANFLTLRNNQPPNGGVETFGECFTINYPISVDLPGTGTVAVGSEEELWETISAFFEDMEEPEDISDFPTILFPINVTLEDGMVQSVANDEELCDLYHECYGDIDDGEWEPGDGEWEEPCFEYAYPINLTLNDGSTVTVNSEEDWETVFTDLGEFEYFEIGYPLNVILADGTTQTIENEEGMEALFQDCYGDGWGEPGDCDTISIENVCFEFVYPISVALPDGSTVAAADEEALFGAIYEFYEQNPNSDEEPLLVYPIDVVLEDGTSQTVNNDDELEELFEECFGDGFGLVNKTVTLGMARIR